MILRVSFPAPGFFVNNPRIEIRLGVLVLYEGSFTSGFDVSVDVSPGHHVLETAIFAPVGNVAKRQRIELPLHAEGGYRGIPEVHAKLEYSRMWGNFGKRASLSVKRPA